MRIQTENVLTTAPTERFAGDYPKAVLHLAWNRRGADRTLLFACIELLPAEVPPPFDGYDPKDPRFCRRLGNDSDHHVYVRHASVDLHDALAWYSACFAPS